MNMSECQCYTQSNNLFDTFLRSQKMCFIKRHLTEKTVMDIKILGLLCCLLNLTQSAF